MADKLSPARRSENMRRIRSANTKPELIVRKLVHGMGYRYKLHRRDLPGKPDLAFGARKKAIFVHGCFWHQHQASACLDGRRPKSNTEYWHAKLERNVERDAQHCAALEEAGWSVLTVWECQTKDISSLASKLSQFLGPPRC